MYHKWPDCHSENCPAPPREAKVAITGCLKTVNRLRTASDYRMPQMRERSLRAILGYASRLRIQFNTPLRGAKQLGYPVIAYAKEIDL